MQQLSLPPCDVAKITEQESDAGFFTANGYLIIKSAFPADLIDGAAEWSRSQFWSEREKRLHGRLQDLWKDCEFIRRIATDNRIMEKIQELYGRKPIPFQTLNFLMGTQQRTHSDTFHFHCLPQRFMCGVWVALEDVHEDNGPLHYYPGSHRLPVLECADVGIDRSVIRGNEARPLDKQKYDLYEDAIQELVEVAGLKKSVVNLSKGDALIWAANLLHGGEPIKEPGATRLSQVTHYFFEGCQFYIPLLSDLPGNYVHLKKDAKNIVTGAELIIEAGGNQH